ncbi:MAG: SPOR domain-containing protein [Gammaproteobacteria bacterium]|nr:SPOR domain-containing protein [Gammaproteobacteria bacterium]MDH3375291.1 SPOR domain-containing protein [Gammaproteobacteria bacterium]
MKERIIGAAVLVVVVVLVVPVFLDGPPSGDEIVSERVPLPGQAEQKSQTIVLERDRKDPVPSNGDSAPKEPTPQPAPQAEAKVPPAQTKPQPKPVVREPVPEQPAPQPSVATASTTGMWAVQLGSFSSQENAEKLAADLRKQGFAAFLSQLSTDSGQLHRVRIGPQKDRASAEAMAERLRKAGQKGQVVPHP